MILVACRAVPCTGVKNGALSHRWCTERISPLFPQTEGEGSLVARREEHSADSENGEGGSSHKGQGQERTEHAVAKNKGVGSEMTIVMDVMKTGIALCRCHPLFLFVSMKRSEQEHWDEYS